MYEQFRQSDFSDIDFSFVYSLDEPSLEFFFELTDLAILAFKETLEQDRGRITQLQPLQIQEITSYYRKLLDLYTDYELYEDCESLVYILNILEIKEENVGSMVEKR